MHGAMLDFISWLQMAKYVRVIKWVRNPNGSIIGGTCTAPGCDGIFFDSKRAAEKHARACHADLIGLAPPIQQRQQVRPQPQPIPARHAPPHQEAAPTGQLGSPTAARTAAEPPQQQAPDPPVSPRSPGLAAAMPPLQASPSPASSPSRHPQQQQQQQQPPCPTPTTPSGSPDAAAVRGSDSPDYSAQVADGPVADLPAAPEPEPEAPANPDHAASLAFKLRLIEFLGEGFGLTEQQTREIARDLEGRAAAVAQAPDPDARGYDSADEDMEDMGNQQEDADDGG